MTIFRIFLNVSIRLNLGWVDRFVKENCIQRSYVNSILTFFGHNSKSIGHGAVQTFLLFYLTYRPVTWGLNKGFYTYCLNALFYLYQTKLRPTFSHWILTFYSSFESLSQKWLYNFCEKILHRFLHRRQVKGNLLFFSFSWNHI